MKFMQEHKSFFVLHVGPELHRKEQIENTQCVNSRRVNATAETKKTENKKRSIKTVLVDGVKQIVVTLLIMVIGFFAINYQAYYEIIKNKIEEYMGIKEKSQLTDMVEPAQNTEQKLLSTDKSTMKQVKEIPPLNLEITPPDTRLIIPRINKNIPVVRVSSEHLIEKDWNALEKDMQEALKNGVVHYPGTSLPDQTGNTVITGHSSYFPWDPGRFKDVFALLHEVVVGDKIAMYYNQHKYIYKVYEIKVVLPSNLEILKQTTGKRLTLITCTPVGTNLKRLVVIADLFEEQN